jgi:hypothetical protein
LLGSRRLFVRFVRELAVVAESSGTVSVVISDDCCLLALDDVLVGTSSSERFFLGLSGVE